MSKYCNTRTGNWEEWLVAQRAALLSKALERRTNHSPNISFVVNDANVIWRELWDPLLHLIHPRVSQRGRHHNEERPFIFVVI